MHHILSLLNCQLHNASQLNAFELVHAEHDYNAFNECLMLQEFLKMAIFTSQRKLGLAFTIPGWKL